MIAPQRVETLWMPSPLLDPNLPATPDIDVITERYRTFERSLTGGSRATWLPTFHEWDALRRELRTWSALTQLRSDQDTTNSNARAARNRRDELAPALTGFDIAMKRTFTASGQRDNLEAALGTHAFRLWETDLSTFEPAVEADLVREAKLGAEYSELIAGITVDFDGRQLNLSALHRYASDPDREVRHRATALRWSALAERSAELDDIFDRLVHVRDAIAHTLGFADFTALGYARMRRVDYDRVMVERYRDAVVAHVVPVAAAIAARAAKRLGATELALWDELLLDGGGPVTPKGDARWIMDTTIDGFASLAPQLGDFAALMDDSDLLDLVTRNGKASGGYCTMLPDFGMPFVFTNFNGSKSDITVLMHELGHAFQGYSSRDKSVVDYLVPTFEAAEVHSMSLEYLAWPLMDRFFERDADAYKRNHLSESLLFIPYGVAVDHFQHLVYERPNATAQERHAMWRWVERRYLPWRTYGDLERPAAGAFWQSQQHVYRSPFYYIDYTLAACCALQMWAASCDDREHTLARYIALCARGGESNFRDLIASAGIASPFDADALPHVLARAKAILNL